MGGVLCGLGALWCRAGCSSSRVASYLAFFPPRPPFYRFQTDPKTKQLHLELSEFILGIVAGHPGLKTVEVGYAHTSRGQRVAMLLVPCAGARFTILYSHGNAADIGAMIGRLLELSRHLGVNVVAYDYTGYGMSSGKLPSEADSYGDVTAAVEWALQRLRIHPPSQLILYGQSVGSGPSVFMATKHGAPGAAGLILHSPISSGLRVVTQSSALRCLDIYPNLERICKVRCPVLVMHGTEDAEVPVSHGKQLYEATPAHLRREPWWVQGKGHNDIGDTQAEELEYMRRIRAFLESIDAACQQNGEAEGLRAPPSPKRCCLPSAVGP